MIGFNVETALAELPERAGNASSLYFKQSAYARWAVTEVFKFIDNHPEYETVEAIERFIAMVDTYIYLSATNEMRWIFCIAKDEAEYLRDWCIAEEFRK